MGDAKWPLLVASETIDTCIAEADDVRLPVAVHVGQLALVKVVAAPAAGAGPKLASSNVGDAKWPSPVASATIDARIAEADDVGLAVAVHVRQLARILSSLVQPPAVGRRSWQAERGRPQSAVAGGERDIDAGVAEADDVGLAVAVHVGELARILVVAGPAAGRRGQSCRKLERERRKVPPPVASET